jgi:ribonuclease T1
MGGWDPTSFPQSNHHVTQHQSTSAAVLNSPHILTPAFRMRPLKSLILLAALVCAVVMWQRQAPTGSQPPQTATATRSLPAFLPAEAYSTLDLIARGGPFPHSQDGVVFGNYEHQLPAQSRGYYHEYTVETPGAENRGTRRIITGGTPPEIYYYTDDHYRSFRSFKVNQ